MLEERATLERVVAAALAASPSVWSDERTGGDAPGAWGAVVRGTESDGRWLVRGERFVHRARFVAAPGDPTVPVASGFPVAVVSDPAVVASAPTGVGGAGPRADSPLLGRGPPLPPS
ncbi:hypothetical protein [Natrinema ejinorense]|uniref:Uncharacterized protein n=1 Tax=Natrinema ejinorense TaxID=373386 RepID=A0A2A5QZH6_9EURY|nr:hypothetical protein [Natrinema ejinorense]PCR92237.1 hypothetical protein CP557_17890 [Natrinema ejinorense]